MNRRDFLRFVGTGVVVGPAAIKAILATLPPTLPPLLSSPWNDIRWHIKEFDFGNQVGVALSLTNPQNGQVIRNGVRLMLPNSEYRAYSDFMKGFIAQGSHPYDGLTDIPSDAPDTVRVARQLLDTWAEEESYRQHLVPAPEWWRESTTPGIEDDEVLEGREMWA